MRKQLSLPVAIAFALVLTVVIAAAAGTRGPRFHSVKAEEFERAQLFGLAGEFSGTIGGEMVVNGLPYRLAPHAYVYEIGTGVIPVGTIVQDRYVTLRGLTVNNSSLVYSVIVRPAGEITFQTSDLSSSVHIGSPSAPR